MSQPDIRINGKLVVMVAPFTRGLLTDQEYEQFILNGHTLDPDKLAQAVQEYQAATTATDGQ